MDAIKQHAYEDIDLKNYRVKQMYEVFYDGTFSAIRNNDPTITAFNPFHLCIQRLPQCAGRLADALATNTHIKWIQLELDANYFGTSEHRVASLLQYMRHGKALRRVDIQIDDVDDEIGYENFRLVIQALAESRSLETLKLGINHPLPLRSVAPHVAHLIQTTTSLRELDMMWTDDSNIATAFASNRTIEVLRLNKWSDHENIHGHLFSNYVAQPSMPSRLTELSVTFNRKAMNLSELDMALGMFLQGATPSLQKLRVHSKAFDGEGMKLFLDGIRCPQELHRLELISCRFNGDAMLRFIDFWQNDVTTATSIERGDNDTNPAHQPQYTIKSLYIGASTSDTRIMAEEVAVSLQKSCLLEDLHWVPYRPDYVSEFWYTVSENANEVRLSSLRLDCRNQNAYVAMLQCLPKLQHLHVFRCKAYIRDAKPLLTMVKTNGSLLRFPDYDDDDYTLDRCIWNRTPADKRFIGACFERNKKLPQLLMCARTDSDDDDRHTKRAKHANLMKHDNATTSQPTTAASIPLIPRLFATAQPVTYLAPNYILAGLLKLVDPIGPFP